MATEIVPIIKEVRSRLDLTQGQLAERLKVSLADHKPLGDRQERT